MACWPPPTWSPGSGSGRTATDCKGDYAVNVREIMPLWLSGHALMTIVTRAVFLVIRNNRATRCLLAMLTLLSCGKIILTVPGMRRRHGQEAGSQGGGAGGRAVPEPAPGAGDRPGVPGQRLLRRPRRGAGQVRDGAEGRGRRRSGDRGRGGVRVLPAGLLRRGGRAGGLRAARSGAREARAARRQQADRRDLRLGGTAAGRRPVAAPGTTGRPRPGRIRGAR